MVFLPILLYWYDFKMLFNEALHNDVMSYIIAIPFIFIYLLYRRRKIFLMSVFMSEQKSKLYKYHNNFILGLFLCMFSLVLKFYGSYTFYSVEYHIFSFPIFICGLILIIYNDVVLKSIFFPIIFLFLLIPIPDTIMFKIGANLSIYSSKISYIILKLFSLPVSISFEYGSPIIYLLMKNNISFPFTIDLACSGIYSLIGFFMFSIFITYISIGSLFKKVLIFIVGFPLIYFLNIFRIVFIIFIGYYQGVNLALNIFHILGGWTLIFIGTIILMLFSEKILKINFFSYLDNQCLYNNNLNKDYCEYCDLYKISPLKKNTSKSHIYKNVLITLFIVFLTFIQVPVFTLTEGAPEVIYQDTGSGMQVNNILPTVHNYELYFSYRDEDFEKLSGQDASLFYEYVPYDEDDPMIWVGIEIGATRGCLHSWEVCLVTWPVEQGRPLKVEQIEVDDIHLIENPPLSARYFIYHDETKDTNEAILYWYSKSAFKTLNGYNEKWIKFSVIEFFDDLNEIPYVKSNLFEFASKIVDYWNPISEWSWLSLLIAKNGILLILFMSVIIIILLFSYLYFENTSRKIAKKAFNRISSSEDLLLLRLIKSIQNEVPCEYKIIEKMKAESGSSVELNAIKDKILNAEEVGLIRRKLIVHNDEPYFVWKALF